MTSNLALTEAWGTGSFMMAKEVTILGGVSIFDAKMGQEAISLTHRPCRWTEALWACHSLSAYWKQKVKQSFRVSFLALPMVILPRWPQCSQCCKESTHESSLLAVDFAYSWKDIRLQHHWSFLTPSPNSTFWPAWEEYYGRRGLCRPSCISISSRKNICLKAVL